MPQAARAAFLRQGAAYILLRVREHAQLEEQAEARTGACAGRGAAHTGHLAAQPQLIRRARSAHSFGVR